MATVEESLDSQSQLRASLRAGIESLSGFQQITFTKYIQLVLPLDGSVFWVRADIVSPSALAGATEANALEPNQPRVVVTPAAQIVATGSLHYSTDQRQDEDASYSVNQVVFTSEILINDFEQIGPAVMFIGTFQGIRFAFNQRASFYRQSDIYHYSGHAVYSTMATQIIDTPAQFALVTQPIVTNSLPIWLSMNGAGDEPLTAPGNVTLFPSYLAPVNLTPPFATVHIGEEDTTFVQAIPFLDRDGSHWQLARDRVRITLWGLQNQQALQFQDNIIQFLTNRDDLMGMMNPPPIVRDAKRTQTELQILAQKKTLDVTVSYYQHVARDLARQLILKAIVNFILGNYFIDDGGVITLSEVGSYPTSPAGLPAGAVWSNGLAVAIVPGFIPVDGTLSVRLDEITAPELLVSGAGALPTSPPANPGYLWNNGGELAVSLPPGPVIPSPPPPPPPPYHASAVHFDGSTWAQSAAIAGIAASSLFSFSGWFTLPHNDGIPHEFFDLDPPAEDISSIAIQDGSMTYGGGGTGGSVVSNGIAGSFTFDPAWHHLFGYMDANASAGSKTIKLFLDGVDITGTLNDFDPAFMFTFIGKVLAYPDDPGLELPLMTGDRADWWIAPGVMHTDITTFRNPSTGKPVDPATFPPAAFILSGNASTFLSNTLGTAGALVVQAGALTNAASSPSG